MAFKITPKMFTIEETSGGMAGMAGKATLRIEEDSVTVWRLPPNGLYDLTKLFAFVKTICSVFAPDKPIYVRINTESTSTIKNAQDAGYVPTKDKLTKSGFVVLRAN